MYVNPPSLSHYRPTSHLQDLAAIIKSDKRPRKDYLVVDVRDEDYIGGHIANCHNAPSETFLDNLDDLVRDSKEIPQVIFHCALSQSRWVAPHPLLMDLMAASGI
jgi:rhodanese-related sulfurtransferase